MSGSDWAAALLGVAVLLIWLTILIDDGDS